MRWLKHAALDQPTVHSGGESRGKSVAEAVGCLLFALQWHFNGTSTALQRNFNGTSTVLPHQFHGTSTALQQHKK